MPSRLLLASRELVPPSSRKVNGKAGKRVLISLNTALDAYINIRLQPAEPTAFSHASNAGLVSKRATD